MQVKTFFSKNTSNITPNMFIKSVQNDPKMESKVVLERSPRHFQRKAAITFQKSTKRLQKSTKRLPKRTLKRSSNLTKTVRETFFPHQKNDDNMEAVFSRFLPPAGGPRPSTSSQNVTRVCKNEGPTISRKAALSYKN